MNSLRNKFSGIVLAMPIILAGMSSGTAGTIGEVERAKETIAEHSKHADFVAPGPAFDAKACMQDKKIFVVPLSSSNPFNAEISNSMMESAEAVGFKLTNWENQLKLDQWVQGMQQAIAGGYDLIDLQGGLPPAALGPQIKEARDKGIKVTTTHLFDVTQEIPDNLDLSARTNYSLAGQIMADWAIAKTNGKVNAVIIGSDEIPPTAPFVKSIKDRLDSCENCKHKYINAPISEWGTKIQPSVQAALIADPGINYILPIFDSMSQFVAPALKITNRAGSVKIVSYNGTPFVLDMIRNGDVEMVVGESLGWVGMAGTDANMRLLCGLDKVTELNTPLYIFDSSNVEAAGVPASYNAGYGDVHEKAFLELWGLK